MLSSATKAVLIEAVGTATLLMAIVGSGIAAVDLTDDIGLQLVFNAIATVAVLASSWRSRCRSAAARSIPR